MLRGLLEGGGEPYGSWGTHEEGGEPRRRRRSRGGLLREEEDPEDRGEPLREKKSPKDRGGMHVCLALAGGPMDHGDMTAYTLRGTLWIGPALT